MLKSNIAGINIPIIDVSSIEQPDEVMGLISIDVRIVAKIDDIPDNIMSIAKPPFVKSLEVDRTHNKAILKAEIGALPTDIQQHWDNFQKALNDWVVKSLIDK